MENSQSSDIFDAAEDDTDSIYIKPSNYGPMLSATKEAFHEYQDKIKEIDVFSVHVAKAIKDTWTCIHHGLEDQIKKLLRQQTVPINKIADYLNDSVCLLQTLSQFSQTIVTLVPISCCTMNTFPEQTGQIIFTVFEHCKDSESLYGQQLKSFELQLKDLFRACHDLQLIYLMILEKEFKFQLHKQEDKHVLIEAMRINLKIGQVVESLDVKTMAVQWKGVTAICDKYRNELADTDVCEKSAQILCLLVNTNIESAFQFKQDEKVIMRSLKVASFTIKLLQKICIIFKQSSNINHYSHILELLLNIGKKEAFCLEISRTKPLISLMKTHVTIPAENLLEELLLCERFVENFFNSLTPPVSYDLNKYQDHHLGCLLLLTTAMKCAVQLKRQNLKMKLVSAVYRLLPYSQVWLQSHHQIPGPKQRWHGTFEHVLLSTATLAISMTNEEFNALEKCILEAIISTDCVCALFSTQLWLILARHISPQLLFIQVVWLCSMYKKLCSLKQFTKSPQEIHISHTISNLFKLLDEEDKLKICKQFRLHDEDNISLWTAIRLHNLPDETQRSTEEFIVEKLKNVYKRFFNSCDEESFVQFIQITNLAATCSFQNTREIEDLLIRVWSKVCQEKQTIVKGLERDTIWFYDYVKALASLTATVVKGLSIRSANFIKVLHVINSLITTGDNILKLILTHVLCKMATFELKEHQIEAESYYIQCFRLLFLNYEDDVHQLFSTSREYIRNGYINVIINQNNVVCHENLINIWTNVKNEKYITKVYDGNYRHKCLAAMASKDIKLENPATNALEKESKDDVYFDSAGSEMQSETEAMEEPSSKRGKPNNHEADRIIGILEENASLLVKLNVTPDQIKRIQKVCEKLKNISY